MILRAIEFLRGKINPEPNLNFKLNQISVINMVAKNVKLLWENKREYLHDSDVSRTFEIKNTHFNHKRLWKNLCQSKLTEESSHSMTSYLQYIYTIWSHYLNVSKNFNWKLCKENPGILEHVFGPRIWEVKLTSRVNVILSYT